MAVVLFLNLEYPISILNIFQNSTSKDLILSVDIGRYLSEERVTSIRNYDVTIIW
jgi:hypothetical protein